MTPRRVVFWAHFSMGLAAGLLVAVQALSGMTLAFRPQILAHAEKEFRRVVPPADGHRLTLDALVASAASAGKPSAVTIATDPAVAASVSFGRTGMTYVNPYTGAVLGRDARAQEFFRNVEDFHRRLSKGETGEKITAVSATLFALLVLTGVFLWWPRSIKALNGALSGRARDFNRHNVFGFWASPFLLMISVTGLIMSWPASRPAGDRAAKEESAAGPAIPLEAAASAALARVSAWETVTVRLPQKAGAPYSVWIVESSRGVPVRDQATIDAATGDVVRWDAASTATPGRKVRVWARSLHSGEAGGAIGQTVSFLAAGCALVLIWTGFALALRRLKTIR